MLRARLHHPVDKIEVIKKDIDVNEIHFADGVLYMCGEDTPLSIHDENSVMRYNPDKLSKKSAIDVCKKYDVEFSKTDNLKELKTKLSRHQAILKEKYDQLGNSGEWISFFNNDEFESFRLFAVITRD